MKKQILVRLAGDNLYAWSWHNHRHTDADITAYSGQGSLAELKTVVSDKRDELCLLLAGDQVRVQLVPCSLKERRHVKQAVPYAMEETLVTAVDEMHFSFLIPFDSKDHVAVACCDRAWLKQQLAPFDDAGLEVKRLVPAPLVLPCGEGWTLCLVDQPGGEEVWVRYGKWQGFVLELSLARSALECLGKEQGVPSQLTLLAESEAGLNQLHQLIPAQLQVPVQSHVQPLPHTMDASTTGFDMRQGEFSLQLPVSQWWRQWRWVAVLALTTLALFAAVNGLEYRQLRHEELALRRTMEQEARKVIPRGILQQPVKQLRGKLRAVTGGGDGNASAIALLSQIAPVIVEQKSVVLRSLNFSAKSGELRLSCWAPSFESLQNLRTAISQKGLHAELVQASADGEGQQGRINIRGRES